MNVKQEWHMKRSAIGWPMLIGLGFLWASVGPALAVTLKPVQVVPGVYAFIGEMGGRTYENEGLNANTGFIVTTAGVVVVDSGSSYRVAQQIHRAIQSVTTQPVRYVINTGGQDHRWLGNGYFKSIGAQIIAQRQAVDDMAARGAEEIAGLKADLKDRLAGTEPTLPTRTFDAKETLNLGGTEIQLFHFQGGHTPGDSVVWLPKSRVLFAGDLVFVDRLLGVIPVSNTRDWLASFEAIEKLNPRVIVPGHGNLCDLAKARRETKDYLVLLRTHMAKALASGQDLQTAIDSLDQSRFKYLLNYDSLKGGNASRTYLEMEGD
jgi:glyoxylase-like metal-dependent hydrolase (beta-lactamase superfamily II)